MIGNADSPHVLMRQFAARALSACIENRTLTLPASVLDALPATNRSPYPTRVPHSPRDTPFDRPAGVPPLPFEFHLDYDFHRHDVAILASTFDQPTWEVADATAKVVHALDASVSWMNDAAGRQIPQRRGEYGLMDRHHVHGQQLAWHGLFIVAGELLRSCPVADDPYSDGDAWEEWLSRRDLSRSDGLWLSDGTDLTPIETRTNLLTQVRKEWRVTGDANVVNALVESATVPGGPTVVVHGRWSSADGVRVNIVSALVAPLSASRLARELIRTEPTQVWLPILSPGETEEHARNEKDEFTPWVTEPNTEIRLDEYDPWATPVANARPTLSRHVLDFEGISPADPFGRIWKLKNSTPVLSVQAWGRDDRKTEDGPTTGTRLCCSHTFLRRFLKKHRRDLLVLVKLERYEKADRTHSNSRWIHTVSVLHFSSNRGSALIPGKINHAYENRF